MTADEAGTIQLEEPDWRLEFFDKTIGYDYFQQNEAFEKILFDYRRWHCSGEAPNRLPLDATKAIIALAGLGVMPPRWAPHNDRIFDPQFDEHCWLINERAWRIETIEARTIFLNSFGDQKQIDMNAVNWEKYVEAREAIIKI